MLERQQLLREQCSKKPANPSFVDDADFTRFIVIEKLKFVFCFIPKVSCTTWKRTLYTAKNPGNVLHSNPHKNSLFKWLKDYSPDERKEILDTYYKAMFVREPFERLAAAYRDQHTNLYFRKMFHPEIKNVKELKKGASDITFAKFVRDDLLRNNKTTLETNQHWRSYEQICPCEVKYDFIGHFENLAEEAPQLLRIIGVDDYVTFPDHRPSKSQPYMLEYYSQLTKDEIFTLGKIFELDFKLFGYDFPGPLKDVLKNKTLAEAVVQKQLG